MKFLPSYGKFIYNVKELIQSAIERKQRINALRKDQLEKLAAIYEINNQNLTKELVELAVVELARELAYKPGTIRQRFESIVELYSYQGNLSHRTSHSMLLQQYSTPAPIAYLMGVFCGIDKSGHNPLTDLRGRFFEPSAGNGMLTIASDTQSFIVNDIDEVRNANLHHQNYYQVLAFDGTKDWTLFLNYDAIFDSVITNPPFGKLPEPVTFDGFKITELDHLMSIRALDTMKDSGRAAIIIGGNTTWDEQGRIQAGKNRMFFSYLHKHYNVLDVLNIDGTLYSRMGTSFDVRVILIDGRKPVPGGFPPLYSKTQDATIHDFDSYYKRIEKYIRSGNAESLQVEMKNNPAVIDIIKHHSPFGISKVVASYLKNGNTPEFKNDFNRVFENPNYNTKEKFARGIDEFKRERTERIESIEKDLKKWVETGGESMKSQPHYKNQLAIIQGNKYIIEIADTLTDILFTQNNSELELEAESVSVELELISFGLGGYRQKEILSVYDTFKNLSENKIQHIVSEYYKTIQGSFVINQHKNITIHFISDGRNESIFDERRIFTSQLGTAVINIKQLLTVAKLTNKKASKGKKSHKRKGIAGFLNFYAKLEIDGKLNYFRIPVAYKKSGRTFHYHISQPQIQRASVSGRHPRGYTR